LALAANVFAEQINVADDNERRRKNWPRFVLYHEDVSLEFPQQVGNCVGADENSTANSNQSAVKITQ